MVDSQYGLMNILAVQTLFIEHPLYNQRLCTQVILNRWQRKTFSKDFSHLVTQPRYCSSLRSFFHFAVILLSWMKRWMKACSYPYARMRQSLLEPAVHWSLPLSPAPLSQRWPRLVKLCGWKLLPAPGQAHGFWMDYKVGGKLAELSGWKSCDQQLKVQELSLRDQWQGQHSFRSSLMPWTMGWSVLPAGSQVSPNSRVDDRVEGTVLQLEEWSSTSIPKLNKSNLRAQPPSCDTPRKQDRMRLTGETADLQKRFRLLLGNK